MSRPSARPGLTRSQRAALWGYALTLAFVAAVGGLALGRPARPPAKSPAVRAAGFERAYAVAFHPPGPNPRWVYVACAGRVLRYPAETEGSALIGGYASSRRPSSSRATDTAR